MARRRVELDRLQELVRLHRMGMGAREVARMLEISPNTEREYRCVFEAEGLLDGDVDALPPLEVLRAAVDHHLPAAVSPQMVSTAAPMRDRIVELARLGLKPQAIFDRLRLEIPSFKASFWAVRGLWRRWGKERATDDEAGGDESALELETLLEGFGRAHGLSRREAQIVALASTGHRTKEIGAALGCAPQTIGTYWERIYRKTQTASREMVLALVLRFVVDAARRTA